MNNDELDAAGMVLITIYLSIVLVAMLFFMALAITQPPDRPRKVCPVAEISPDVTQEERERCRMIRGHKL